MVGEQRLADAGQAARVFDVRDVLVLEVAQGRHDRARSRRAEAAGGGARNNHRQVAQLGDVLHLALAVGDPFQDLQHALGTFAARNALAAGLVLGEAQEELGEVHHARARVGDHQAARAHHAAELFQAFVVDGGVHALGRNTRARRAACLRTLDSAAFDGATADLVQKLVETDAHRHFDEAGVPYLARQGEYLRSAGLLGADAAEPRHAFRDNERHVGEGLDVVHTRRVTGKAMRGRVRRFVASHAALALDAGDHRGFFAAHKGARALHDFDVEGSARAKNVRPKKAVKARLRHGDFQAANGQWIFRAAVDEACSAPMA